MTAIKKAEIVEPQSIEDCVLIRWRKLEVYVYRLQKRIFRAARITLRSIGNVRAVHSLQRLLSLLMKSDSVRCLAVRRVTQDNKGKNTAGVDGIKSVWLGQRPTFVLCCARG